MEDIRVNREYIIEKVERNNNPELDKEIENEKNKFYSNVEYAFRFGVLALITGALIIALPNIMQGKFSTASSFFAFLLTCELLMSAGLTVSELREGIQNYSILKTKLAEKAGCNKQFSVLKTMMEDARKKSNKESVAQVENANDGRGGR